MIPINWNFPVTSIPTSYHPGIWKHTPILKPKLDTILV